MGMLKTRHYARQVYMDLQEILNSAKEDLENAKLLKQD